MGSKHPLFECTVADIAEQRRNAIVGGPFGSDLVSKDYVPSGVPVIRGANMGQGRWVSGEFVYVTAEKANSLSANCAAPGDLVFTQRGTLGQVALIPEHGQKRYLISQSQMKLTVDGEKADALFLYYVFSGAEQQEYVRTNAIQTGVPHTNLGILKRTPLNIPPLETQKQVAAILGRLDDKIDLNRRINQTLEAMAQTTFKSWFIDFDPVKAKVTAKLEGRDPLRAAMGAISGKHDTELDALPREQFDQLAATAALFPDEMEESELGEIPQGWEAKSIGDMARFANGKVKVSALSADSYISTENMLENKAGVTRAASLPSMATVPSFARGQVLVSNIRPYFKKIWMARFDGGRSPDVLAFEAVEQNCTEFLYNLMYQDVFFDFMTRTAKGAKMPRGDKDSIVDWKFSCADYALRSRFSEKVRSYYLHIECLNSEAQCLAELRDTLLPKLLAGAG